MKKEDLKTGMVVKLRDGEILEVLKGMGVRSTNDVLRGTRYWMALEDYDENLILIDDEYDEFDIMEIYKPTSYLVKPKDFPERYKSIWKREQEKFYLKHKWLEGYLNYYKPKDKYALYNEYNTEGMGYKTQFTFDELENIEKGLGIKLRDFTLIPVGD